MDWTSIASKATALGSKATALAQDGLAQATDLMDNLDAQAADLIDSAMDGGNDDDDEFDEPDSPTNLENYVSRRQSQSAGGAPTDATPVSGASTQELLAELEGGASDGESENTSQAADGAANSMRSTQNPRLTMSMAATTAHEWSDDDSEEEEAAAPVGDGSTPKGDTGTEADTATAASSDGSGGSRSASSGAGAGAGGVDSGGENPDRGAGQGREHVAEGSSAGAAAATAAAAIADGHSPGSTLASPACAASAGVANAGTKAKSVGLSLVAENAELRQQLQVQAQELDRLDRLLVSGQQELATMRDRLQRTKQAARERLRALNEELEEEQRAREEVEEALEAAEAEREESAGAHGGELASARAKCATVEADLAAAKQELERLAAARLQDELSAERGNGKAQNELRQLRQELRDAEQRLKQQRQTQHNTMRTADTREAELEAANAELTRTLALRERALAEATAQARGAAAQQASSEASHRAEAELSGCREQLKHARAKLVEAKEEQQSLRTEAQSLAAELSTARAEHATARAAASEQLRGHEAELAQVRAELAKMTHNASQADGADERAAARIKALSNSLLEKSEQVNLYSAELEALRGRLTSEQRRSAAAQQRVTELERGAGTGVDDAAALESGAGGGLFRRRRREESIAKLQLIARSERLARAADWLDKFAMDTGRFLRNEPIARFMFLCYLLLLHAWALFVLGFHSQHLEKMHADTGGTMVQGGRPADPANVHLHVAHQGRPPAGLPGAPQPVAT